VHGQKIDINELMKETPAPTPTPDAWQDASNKAQQFMAVQQERELAVKKAVTEILKAKTRKTVTVRIFGNEIRISALDQYTWRQLHLDAYAKELACYALMADADEAEKAHSQPLYQYFHVTLDDSERTAGEAIAKRADYSAISASRLRSSLETKQDRLT
jgi:hypothetical protein